MVAFSGFLSSCQKQALQTQPSDSVFVEYKTDNLDSLDWTNEAASSALPITGPKARLTIQYLNNETDLFRPARFSTRLWYFGSTEPTYPERAAINALGDTKYDMPDLIISRENTGRAYTRRTIPDGWYIAEYDQEGTFYKFQAVAGSDGLLVYNQHDTTAPLMAGYFTSYGKIEVTFGADTGIDEQAFVHLSKGQALQRFWLYAEDATDQVKSLSWFIPAGTYDARWFRGGGPNRSGAITIATGKRYPNLKF
ncbi:hypothetical protein [Spirosoma oryzicola]|uniref:hypothetical protein n=1 Tax=Spirosoma oryzicola TaxID=2898794 RepID=UPI001E559271|nr:hypothetical protein [Spirosoma oryzicola]UHG94385.1 hypothetical protein LQ777_27765 [Spirosoma oryzicola]